MAEEEEEEEEQEQEETPIGFVSPYAADGPTGTESAERTFCMDSTFDR